MAVCGVSVGKEISFVRNNLKGEISGLIQFLAIERPFKMMKNAFSFTSKALFVLKLFKFLSQIFGHLSKRFH